MSCRDLHKRLKSRVKDHESFELRGMEVVDRIEGYEQLGRKVAELKKVVAEFEEI